MLMVKLLRYKFGIRLVPVCFCLMYLTSLRPRTISITRKLFLSWCRLLCIIFITYSSINMGIDFSFWRNWTKNLWQSRKLEVLFFSWSTSCSSPTLRNEFLLQANVYDGFDFPFIVLANKIDLEELRNVFGLLFVPFICNFVPSI